MEPFRTHTGLVAPLDRANVDTDQIIPKQFLKSIRRTGFGPNLFDEWRYLDRGEPGQDASARPLNPEFVLNQPRYAEASVLLARRNFGCGSSREHAPWAIGEYGFRAVIAPSFADIFFNNCFKNGLLPVVLPEAVIDGLFAEVAATPGVRGEVLAGPSATRASIRAAIAKASAMKAEDNLVILLIGHGTLMVRSTGSISLDPTSPETISCNGSPR